MDQSSLLGCSCRPCGATCAVSCCAAAPPPPVPVLLAPSLRCEARRCITAPKALRMRAAAQSKAWREEEQDEEAHEEEEQQQEQQEEQEDVTG